jgi:hypothetical protein
MAQTSTAAATSANTDADAPENQRAQGKIKEKMPSPPRGQKFEAKYHDKAKSSPTKSELAPLRHASMRVKTAADLRPPAWDVAWRYQIRPADMLTKLSHLDYDGLNQPSGWDSTNDCNKDLPGGTAARQELKETLALNQKMNASKRLTNWTYAHGGNELNPDMWSSTTQDQMLKRPRMRTPNKHLPSTAEELRPPPWSVAERHKVHLMKYDHRLVGLRKPEPLAKSAA